MRLDKYLVVSRLIKRRTVAQQACQAKKVWVNGAAAKSGRQVEPGDTLELRLGANPLKVRIESVPKGNVSKERASELYLTLAP